MTLDAFHEIAARRAAMQALTVVRLDGLSDHYRGRILATADPAYAASMCAEDFMHGLATVDWSGRSLCLDCSLVAVDAWLASSRLGSRRVLALRVLL